MPQETNIKKLRGHKKEVREKTVVSLLEKINFENLMDQKNIDRNGKELNIKVFTNELKKVIAEVLNEGLISERNFTIVLLLTTSQACSTT